MTPTLRATLRAMACLGLATACISTAAPANAQKRCQGEAALRSLRGDVKTTLIFINRSASPVRVNWIDYDGRRKEYARLAPGQRHEQSTFASHPWAVTNDAGDCLMVTFAETGRFTVTVEGSSFGRNNN